MAGKWGLYTARPQPGRLVAAAVLVILASHCPAAERAADQPTLKDTFADCFEVGAAVNRRIVGGPVGRFGFGRRGVDAVRRDRELVLRHFNSVSPENDLKWALVHPRPGADGYAWAPADAFVEFGERHGMSIIGHTLVWHSQTPDWVFRADAPRSNESRQGGGTRATREQLLERMREHIHTVVGRYKGRIKVWDVVNEAISDHGDYVLRDSPWRQIIGPDFVAKAFEYAHEADPDAVLRYNDYGLEGAAKRGKLISLIRTLQADGAPVMAIGTQAHLNVTSASFKSMDQSLSEIEALGLPIHVTELDINGARQGQRTTGADVSSNSAATAGGLVAEADRRLAEAYEGVFQALIEHRESLEVVTFWGANDANSWRSRGRPLLFDADSNPKPAFQKVILTAPQADSESGANEKGSSHED
ncbi:Endo-1,4-beta-xylanase B [Posidoniimonas polymericola]|uniref:Beta-xylanase n=1 Tax=Posidoniimonas polymericola TaxID=2528002 RepID=A0A5C5XSJ3_9BACT|nr:endo-1,4-beta-xylanase [Posidoniimonas polymericola]TWT66226.1 Endo-1,4-beta-xylanase B [Posidoniimonas polymericola]